MRYTGWFATVYNPGTWKVGSRNNLSCSTPARWGAGKAGWRFHPDWSFLVGWIGHFSLVLAPRYDTTRCWKVVGQSLPGITRKVARNIGHLVGDRQWQRWSCSLDWLVVGRPRNPLRPSRIHLCRFRVWVPLPTGFPSRTCGGQNSGLSRFPKAGIGFVLNSRWSFSVGKACRNREWLYMRYQSPACAFPGAWRRILVGKCSTLSPAGISRVAFGQPRPGYRMFSVPSCGKNYLSFAPRKADPLRAWSVPCAVRAWQTRSVMCYTWDR